MEYGHRSLNLCQRRVRVAADHVAYKNDVEMTLLNFFCTFTIE